MFVALFKNRAKRWKHFWNVSMPKILFINSNFLLFKIGDNYLVVNKIKLLIHRYFYNQN